MKDIEKFCIEYVKTSNATQSANSAGYKCPAVAGNRLLGRKSIIERIESIKSEASKVYATDNLVLARSLKKKEAWQAQLIQELNNTQYTQERVRILELFAKSEGFLTSEAPENVINILNIPAEQLSDRAQRLIASIGSITVPVPIDNASVNIT